MKRWQYIVDQLLIDAIGDGDVSHLPGAGKPLPLADESHSPEESRVAFKIMRDHNVLPGWIETARALAQQEAELRRRIAELARTCREGLSSPNMPGEARLGAQLTQDADLREWRERILRHNREVLQLNLKLPASLPHKPALNADLLIEQALRRSKERPLRTVAN